MSAWSGLIARYRERLPLAADVRVVSLHEGATPLIRLHRLTRKIGTAVEIFVKYEGLNPTGSFKDRGMTVAVTQALHEGKRAVICASTGNTSASAAAYAARAGLLAFVIIPEGKVAEGKLAQAMIEGATVVQIKGNFDQGMDLVKQVAEEQGLALVNSINPYRLQGQKTAAFEIVEALGAPPDYHCLPVGNAGNITAYWMGYCEAAGHDSACIAHARRALGSAFRCGEAFVSGLPKMVGYQASGAAPILRGHKVEEPQTVATAIRIGNPQSWKQAESAVSESGGWFDECSDDEILDAQKMLASYEGVFCEPASAISIAGLMRDIRAGKIADGARVVCTLTGHGLKDPDTAIRQSGKDRVVSVEAGIEDIRRVCVPR